MDVFSQNKSDALYQVFTLGRFRFFLLSKTSWLNWFSGPLISSWKILALFFYNYGVFGAQSRSSTKSYVRTKIEKKK
jgi:hypothetical protein